METLTPSQSSSSSAGEITATAGEITVTSATSTAINTNDCHSTAQNPQIQSSLRSLNKSSYKISKPPSRNPSQNPSPHPSPQSQPPVYNIDKRNFREVVQKLTGSPSHRHPSHPPSPPTAAAVSRLHRIRPPPLSNLSMAAVAVGPAPSLSPLPPFPAVSAAAESPITAYMRRLREGPSPAAVPPLSPLGFGCSGSAGMVPTSPRFPLPSPR